MKQDPAYKWTKESPYNHYLGFIAPNADRYAILLKCLEALKLNSAVIPVAGNRHIFIFPPQHKTLRSSSKTFPFSDESPFLLTAHYDRVEGSPGANDNSIAVFHLLKTAVTFTRRSAGGWIIVFTDKEELKAGESFEDQGSFTLGEKIKSWGLEKARIYNFDSCGTGDVFIFSSTTDHILKADDRPNIYNVRQNIRLLRNHALKTAQLLRMNKVLLAPTPFSDDVGFLRAGLAAQTITILPEAEAQKYAALLRSRSDFADLLISGRIKDPAERRHLPETWRSLNNAADTPSRLTPQFFDQVVNFMIKLNVE